MRDGEPGIMERGLYQGDSRRAYMYYCSRILSPRVINRSAVTAPHKLSRTSPHKDKDSQRVPLDIARRTVCMVTAV